MIKLIGLVPLFPLIGFLINGFFGKKMSKGLSGIIASVSILASFILSVLIFFIYEASFSTTISLVASHTCASSPLFSFFLAVFAAKSLRSLRETHWASLCALCHRGSIIFSKN